MSDSMFALLFGVRRSVRYHVKRRQFFDRVQNTCSFIAMLAGGGAAATLATKYELGIWLALLASAVSGLALVSRASVKARDHNDLAKAFIDLEKRIAAASDDDYVTLQQARLTLEATEPPVLRVLDVVCYNELCVATGTSGYYRLSPLRRWLCQVSDFGWTPPPPPAPARG